MEQHQIRSARDAIRTLKKLSIEEYRRAEGTILLGNSAGLAFILSLASGMHGSGVSPRATLWPAIAFAVGVLIGVGKPLVAVWVLRRYRWMIEWKGDLTGLDQDMEKAAVQRARDHLGEEYDPRKHTFAMAPRLPSFLPLGLSAACFAAGVIGGFVVLYM